ncbi:MAG: CheR family methyltransferase [Solirubrobacterales bacterium]
MTSPLVSDPDFPSLKSLVIDTTGMAFYADKDDDLARIVSERMATIGSPTCAHYLACLGDGGRGKEEMDALVAELTIGETYFFRHKEQFDALKERILPDVIARNRSARRIRIWSAGCATGPEPYSIAIMLKREFGVQIAGWHVSIIGTDINQKFLARARDGRYDDWAFRATPDSVREECFTKVGRQWQIRPEYKAWVSFQYHNLTRNRFPSILDNIAGFDIIICRNVVIYFSPETIQRLVPCFRETLVDGGWLVMGHAEPNQDLFRSFQTVNVPGAVLYQRIDHPQPAPASIRPPAMPAAPVAVPDKAKPIQVRKPLAPTPLPVAAPPGPVAAPAHGEISALRDLADRGQWEEAIKACDRLIEMNSLDAKLHFYRALVLEQLGDNDESERSLRRAIYLDRHFVLPHYHLGLFLWRKDERDAALRSFRNVLALLERFADDHPFTDGDDITAGQLRETVGMHLKLIGAS